MQRNRMIRRMKATLLVTVAATGGTMFSSCGLADLQNSAIAGTQVFAQSYVADLLATFVPSAASLLGNDDGT
ncbi:MAG: hypothetical protein IID38_06330 [Planctomycetes bacterium]|nr:hypothetical protein [Planctomycetota bacterium]